MPQRYTVSLIRRFLRSCSDEFEEELPGSQALRRIGNVAGVFVACGDELFDRSCSKVLAVKGAVEARSAPVSLPFAPAAHSSLDQDLLDAVTACVVRPAIVAPGCAHSPAGKSEALSKVRAGRPDSGCGGSFDALSASNSLLDKLSGRV